MDHDSPAGGARHADGAHPALGAGSAQFAARQVAAVSFGRGLGDNPAIREKPMSEAVAVGAGEGGALAEPTIDVTVFAVLLNERGMPEVHRQAVEVSDPDSPRYGEHWSRAELAGRTAPDEEGAAAVQRWFAGFGMATEPTASPLLFHAVDAEGRAEEAFPGLGAWLGRGGRMHAPLGPAFRLPPALDGYVKTIYVSSHDQSAQMALEAKGIDHRGDLALSGGSALPAPPPAPRRGSPLVTGATPADVARIYGFPADGDGAGETIGLLSLGGCLPSREDLEDFWRGHGLTAMPAVEVHYLSSDRTDRPSRLGLLEITMTVQWIGAMAPGARVVLYHADPGETPDPWSAFLLAALGDEAHAPTVLVSTWTWPERLYYGGQRARVFDDLLDQAAAVGVTVVAASGDWGVYDGRPSFEWEGAKVAHAAWPNATFPAVAPGLLAVGGTMITALQPLTELAWSGPLPPDEQLRQALPLTRLATSGGFSDEHPVPPWQAQALGQRPFPRSGNTPAVLPYGRGVPDVSLMAQGPAVMQPSEPGQRRLSSVGYSAIVGGTPLNYAGGTSVAAPIWAAIIARANQARRAAGRPRLGFVNPLLYRLAGRGAPGLRSIEVGDSDVELKVVDGDGKVSTYLLEGYLAGPAWDPCTGLGVPVVGELIAQLVKEPVPTASATPTPDGSASTTDGGPGGDGATAGQATGEGGAGAHGGPSADELLANLELPGGI